MDEMDEYEPEAGKSRWLTIVFFAYLALIMIGWGCVLADEATVMAYVAQGASTMLTWSAILAVIVGTPWWLILHRRKENGKPRPAPRTSGMLFAMVGLIPFFLYAGIGFLTTVPFWISDRMQSESAKTNKLAISPDGKWQAYVIGKPAFDGPDWQLYLKPAGAAQGQRVARLMGDVDWNHEILWSPRSDVVIFRNHYSLFAIRPADLKSAAMDLGAKRHIYPSGTFSVDGRQLTEVSDIKFPEAGGVEYTASLKGKREAKRLPAEAFQSRPEGWAVTPFAGEPGE